MVDGHRLHRLAGDDGNTNYELYDANSFAIQLNYMSLHSVGYVGLRCLGGTRHLDLKRLQTALENMTGNDCNF